MMASLDQFYTKPDTAKYCWSILQNQLKGFLDINPDKLEFIEPSAGRGDFLILLPKTRRVGIDIDPQGGNDLLKQDFLTYHCQTSPDRTVVIGNPPFGHRSKMAVNFFEHASQMADTIAFIVPVQWRKYSIHKQLNTDFQLISQTCLPSSSFYIKLDQDSLFRGDVLPKKDYHVNTEFQIWTRLRHNFNNKRILKPPPTTHVDFYMWQYNATNEALKVFNNDFDFAVLRQGYGDFNKKMYNRSQCSLKKQWILFKAKTKKILNTLNNIDFSKLSRNNTVVPGFGKADVVKEYEIITNANTKLV